MAPKVERLTRNSRTGLSRGRREIRLTTPAIAPAPYSADADPLDHFDLSEIHRRNLQQTESADLLAEERQTVGEKARVAPRIP